MNCNSISRKYELHLFSKIILKPGYFDKTSVLLETELRQGMKTSFHGKFSVIFFLVILTNTSLFNSKPIDDSNQIESETPHKTLELDNHSDIDDHLMAIDTYLQGLSEHMYHVNTKILNSNKNSLGSNFEKSSGYKRIKSGHNQVIAKKFSRKRIAVGKVELGNNLVTNMFKSKSMAPVRLNKEKIMMDSHQHQKPEFEVTFVRGKYNMS